MIRDFHNCQVLDSIQEHKEVIIYKESERHWFFQATEYGNFNGDSDVDITTTPIIYCPYCGEFLK